MPGLLGRLLPQEKSFFDAFVELAKNVHEASGVLLRLLKHYDDAPALAVKIEDLEHTGDTLTHQLLRRLNKTFITPFDREDLHELASKIDDVLDLIEAAANGLILYRVTEVRPGMVRLAEIVHAATEQMLQALRILEKQHHILDYCIEINRLENEADVVSRKMIADLFDQEKDPILIIKWKEIIETLEFATDKCEDVANVIETITMKNA
jgi:uncharacterized protein